MNGFRTTQKNLSRFIKEQGELILWSMYSLVPIGVSMAICDMRELHFGWRLALCAGTFCLAMRFGAGIRWIVVNRERD